MLNDTETYYIDAISRDKDVSIIYVDSSTQKTIVTVPLDLTFFHDYSNIINQNIPEGYTNDSNKAAGDYKIGTLNIKASEHHLKFYYLVAPLKQQSSITVNYLLHDSIVSSNTTTQAVGNIFDLSQVDNNIPSGYQFLNISSEIPNEYTYQDQIFNIELTQDPTTSSVEFIYEDEDTGNILNSFSISGKIGSTFAFSTYESQLPTNYYLDHASNNDNTFSTDSNIIIFYCKIETGTITIQYSNSGNIISSTSVTGNVGSNFNVSQYTNNIPNGYSYVSDNGSQVPTFQQGNQTLTINVQPTEIYVQVNYTISGGPVVGTYTYSNKPGHQGWAGFNVPSGYSLAPGSNFANFTYGDTDSFGYNVYVVSSKSSSSSAPASSTASSGLSPAEQSEESSMESSYASMEKSMSEANQPIPVTPVNTGSAKVTFNFMNRGSIMIDPTFTLPCKQITLQRVFKLMKNEYADVSPSKGTFRATYGGTKFKTYYPPSDRKINITPATTTVTVNVKRA